MRGLQRNLLEVGVGGETVVDARAAETNADDGVALGEPIGKRSAETELQFEEFGERRGFRSSSRNGGGTGGQNREDGQSGTALAGGLTGRPKRLCTGIIDVDVSRTLPGLGGQIIDGGNNTLRIKVPLHKETVGRHAAMQRAGRDSIEIRNVMTGDGAETIDVEVGVFGFERIEGPLNEANVTAESVIALSEFELTADAAVAVRRKNSGHMGVEKNGVVADRDKSLGETDHEVTIEGPQDLAAGMVRDDKSNVRFGFEFGVAPNVEGDFDTAPEFVEGMKWADGDVSGHFEYKLSVFSFKYRGDGTEGLGGKAQELRSFALRRMTTFSHPSRRHEDSRSLARSQRDSI